MKCPYETEACKKNVHCTTCSYYVEPEGITTTFIKTNADYIRSMTDDEMVEWLVYEIKCSCCDAEDCDEEFCLNLMREYVEHPYEET